MGTTMKRLLILAWAAAFAFGGAYWGPSGAAHAKDMMLTAVHPNNLILIDLAARKVVREYTISGRGYPQTIVPSPDGKVAYVLTGGWGIISGIDLDTGQEVFRADMSKPVQLGKVRRVKVVSFTVSRDGKELFAFQSGMEIGRGEFIVDDETRIAVYRTDAGTMATPVRTFPAPRRISILVPSVDGKTIYGVGWDIYGFDTKTGEIVETYKMRNWGRKNYGEPDVLDFWQQHEQAEIFSTPYYAAKSEPEDFVVGLTTLDLKTREFQMHDFESIQVIIFSSVINPVKRDEAYLVYTTLAKLDLNKNEIVKRVDLDHTYYTVNVSTDGKELYVGGTMGDIAIYDTDLNKIGSIEMPGGADMSLAHVRIFQR